MIAFGHFPRTRVLDGEPGAWAGRNSLGGGIQVYRLPNSAGIWAQEFWEWRLSLLWVALAFALITAGGALRWLAHSGELAGGALMLAGACLWQCVRRAAAREIYSHAITLEAARMLSLACSEAEMVASLTTYAYCKHLSRDALLIRLRAGCPKARQWCEKHRARIARLVEYGRR